MNYESGVMAEKGEPITVGLDEDPSEFEASERRVDLQRLRALMEHGD